MLNLHIDVSQIIIRILLTALIAGAIGWDRQKKNRPAGVQVHVLVAVGATIVAMMQQELTLQAIKTATENADVSNFVANDAARLIAAVVSGIGFLGAGTIVVTKRVVRGLSTAASLWATAAIGIAVGMGYYPIAIIGGLAIFAALLFLELVLRVDMGTDIEIKLIGSAGTETLIENFFKTNNIRFIPKDFQVEEGTTGNVFIVSYAIKRPQNLTYPKLAEELLQVPEVSAVNLTSY